MVEVFFDGYLHGLLDNVPNSLTNQRSILVSSSEFTPLQVTLLSCVDDIIEISHLLARCTDCIAAGIRNSRVYVAFIYNVSNVLGAVLVDTLPWENKIGLLLSVWITGNKHPFCHLGYTDRENLGVETTGFVLSLSWLSSVTAGDKKRVTTNAIMLSAYRFGNAAGPFMPQARYLPR